jgi:hypothetical protein
MSLQELELEQQKLIGVRQLKLEKSEKWGIEQALPAQYPIFRYLHIKLRKS